MESPFVSLTNILFYLLLVIILVALLYHFFGTKNISWIRSNKEEKIKISANSFFNANNYVIHTGSGLFLSSSGSFKRFDIVDREEPNKANQQPSTPLWSLPEEETEIPPQPLRPAPATISVSNVPPTKSVTFTVSDEKIKDEVYFLNNLSKANDTAFTTKLHLIEAPPPAKNTTTHCITMYSESAIPRPTIRRLPNNEKFNVSESKSDYANAQLSHKTNPFISNTYNNPIDKIISRTTETVTTNIHFPLLDNNSLGKNPFTIEINKTKPNPNNVANNIEFRSDFRQRSFSETEVSKDNQDTKEPNSCLEHSYNTTSIGKNPFSQLSRTITKPERLQKTISEDHLFRNIKLNSINVNKSLWRQESSNSLLHFSDNSNSLHNLHLEETISCSSVASEDDLFDKHQKSSEVYGNLYVNLKYDTDSISEGSFKVTVYVGEIKDIICPFRVNSVDTFIRVYLIPDQVAAQQTQTIYNSANPVFNESFEFYLRKTKGKHSLWFHLYHNGSVHTLLGEAELEINEVPTPVTTWLPLSDARASNSENGEMMFSLSYLPTAERLTIVIVKARNLDLDLNKNDPTSLDNLQNLFVKVYIMNNERKVLKKRTSIKRPDRNIVFNEAMIFSMPPSSLATVQLRFTIYAAVEINKTIMVKPLGHIIAGSCATGKGLRHWHQMLSSLRKPVAMWHMVRRFPNQPTFIGGAEAVAAAIKKPNVELAKRNSIF